MSVTPSRPAPGAPGIPAKWTSSAKSAVGTAPSSDSRVWFTISHGILNEIYYPRVDYACTRDFGLIVTDGGSYFSEEKRDSDSVVRAVDDGVPAFALTNRCIAGRYVIEKTVLTDPRRDVLLQRVVFRPLEGTLADYRLYALLAPHLVNAGSGNTAWIDVWKGRHMLFAEGRGHALALGCSAPFKACSAGYAGVSDGWQDLSRHFELRWTYDHAPDGNVALTGEIDLVACDGDFVLALGFGRRPEEAAHRVIASLADGVADALERYVAGWRDWQEGLLPLDPPHRSPGRNPYRVSTSVLRVHEASSFPGGIIASLSVPWGFAKGDDDLGGYHLVWPRDLVSTAGGLLAIGARAEALRVVRYLEAIQESDGRWPQNCWLDGTAYWGGVQMDECALPVLLVDLVWREGNLSADELARFWPMVRRAIGFVLRNGPVTGQDRWEEEGGYSPFTLAVEIAALLAAADLADVLGVQADAVYLRETADAWNDEIEHWTFATDTALAHELGIPGYYVRIAPEDSDGGEPIRGLLTLKNRQPGEGLEPAAAVVSPDALALVRFGLRAADDPRILATIRAIDALLKVELPSGPCWRRYNGDGYGEHNDGAPYDGTGVGRAWPLLTGERAHYELAAGRRAEAERLLQAFEGFASDGHLLPEQVWDSDDVPERELFRGHPSGSAMPLVWAHAEHVKLLRSLRDGRVFDRPPQPVRRYQELGIEAQYYLWRFNQKCRSLPAGKQLRIELERPATVRWTSDAWRTFSDSLTRDTGFGLYTCDIDAADLTVGAAIEFTFHWSTDDRWEGRNFSVRATAKTKLTRGDLAPRAVAAD